MLNLASSSAIFYFRVRDVANHERRKKHSAEEKGERERGMLCAADEMAT